MQVRNPHSQVVRQLSMKFFDEHDRFLRLSCCFGICHELLGAIADDGCEEKHP
jgi:hypothetical protein